MRTLNIFLVAIITLTGVVISDTATAQPGFRANVSFNTFYSELSPYGQWTTMPRYGQVWIYNEPGFRPYSTNGQWEETDMGMAWQSDYPWGWAPFHYGRWEYDPAYGWFWIPGYEYAPAWVAWSEVDNYYGWAPLGFGVDINISIGRIPSNWWVYAPRGYIGYRNVGRYCVPYERNHVYYRRQQPIVNINVYNNVRYSGGPRDYRRYDNRDYNNRPYDVRRNDNRRTDDRRYNPRNYNNSNDNRRDEVRRNDAPPAPVTRPNPGSRPENRVNQGSRNEERRNNVAPPPNTRVTADNRPQQLSRPSPNINRPAPPVRDQNRISKAEVRRR